MMRCWCPNARRTPGGSSPCCRSDWRSTGSRSIRRRPGSSQFGARGEEAARPGGRRPSTVSASRTTGAGHVEGYRPYCARRHGIASRDRCGPSHSGAVAIAIFQWRSSSASSARSCADITRIRDHRESSGALAFLPSGRASVAPVAGPPLAPGPDVVEAVLAPQGALSASAAPGRALGLSSRSESLSRGAGCASRARPDPWEPRAGNRPGLPGCAGHGAQRLTGAGNQGGENRLGSDLEVKVLWRP